MNEDSTSQLRKSHEKRTARANSQMRAKTRSNQNPDESFGSFIVEIVKMFLLAVVIIVPIRIFLFQPFIVRGESMEPNFSERQYLIINELGYKNVNFFDGGFEIEPRKTLDRQEVLVFRSPRNPSDFFIKRVIGLPGETVKIEDGKVYIINEENPEGYELKETYLPTGRRTLDPQTVAVGEDEYFVMGDNRSASSDSRQFGPIKMDAVIGRVFFRAFPFDSISTY